MSRAIFASFPPLAARTLVWGGWRVAIVACAASCAKRAEPATSGEDRLEVVVQQTAPGPYIAFSPDGRLLATTGDDGTSLWEAATGRLVRELPAVRRDIAENGHDGTSATRFANDSRGLSAVFSPDGRYVAALPLSLKREMDITDWRSAEAPAIWHVSTGEPLTSAPWQLEEGDLRVAGVPLTLSQLLAWTSARDDSSARRVLTDVRALRGVSADGRRIVTFESALPRTISIREMPSGRVVARLPRTYDEAKLVAISPDARWVAVFGDDVVDLWDVTTLRRAALTKQPDISPRSIAFSPDSRYLAIGGNRLLIVRVADRAVIGDQPFETALGEGLTELEFSRDGSMLAGSGSSLRIFSSPSGKLLREFLRPTLAPITAWSASASAIALVRDRSQDELAGLTGAVELWPLDSGVPRSLDSMPVAPAQLHFAPRDSALLVLRVSAARHECRQDDCANSAAAHEASLDRVDLRTGATVRLLALGRTTERDGADFLVDVTTGSVLAYDRRGARLTTLGASGPPLTLARDSAAAWPCERERCTIRVSTDRAHVVVAGRHDVLVFDAVSGALKLEHDFQSDTSDATIYSARFIPGDSSGVAILVSREAAPGSTLYRFDAQDGSLRELMRFPDRPDDALFVRNRVLVRTGSVVRIHDMAGEPLAWLVRSTSGRWGVATPDGLYDGTSGGPELFVWRSGTSTYAPVDLSPRFKVPGLLPRIMRGERVVPPALIGQAEASRR